MPAFDDLITRLATVEVNISVQINLLPAPGTGGTTTGPTAAQTAALLDVAQKLEADLVTLTSKVTGTPPVTAAPVITLRGEDHVTVTQPDVFSDPGATTNDGSAISVSGSHIDATTGPGEYEIFYDAANSFGAAATVTRTVTIVAAV